MNKISKARASLVIQHGFSDCGVACLLMIIRYHGGSTQLETLRSQSGTTREGTSLLGLYQSASKNGLSAEGYEASHTSDLKGLKDPVILHVTMENRMNHYVVLFEWNEQRTKFLIGDPARGIIELKDDELDAIWRSKKLLKLEPSESFKHIIDRNERKNWFVQLLTDDYSLLAMASVLGIVFTILGLSTAIFSQKLVDKILPGKNLRELIMGLVFLFLLLIARGFVGYLRGFLLNKQRKDFNVRISGKFFNSLMFLSKSFFDSKKTGELIARMNDTFRIQQTLALFTGGFVINALIVVASVSYIFYFSISLGIISLLSFPAFFILVWKYQDDIIANQREIMISYARTESNYIDSIQGITVIKSNNLENTFISLTRTVYGSYQESIYNLGKIGLKFSLYAESLAALLVAAIFGYSSHLVLINEMTTGELFGILIVTGGLIPSVVGLSLLNIQAQEAKIAFDRMYEFAHLNPEYGELQQTESDVVDLKSLELQNISFGFSGKLPLFNSVSFKISKGEMMAVLGESGTGKSTLIQLLQRFYAVDNGAILVNHEEWSSISTRAWRSVIGVAHQDDRVFSGTVVDNISMTLEPEESKVLKFCEANGFTQYFESFPDGFYTMLGEDGVKISGGQRQLVCLARALYKHPQLLLLDEATSSMDLTRENFVMDLLMNLKKSMCIIIVTHKTELAEKADHVFRMEAGTLKPAALPA